MLLICFVLSGCSLMTKSGRQQLAYRNYVRKHIRERQRQISRARPASEHKLKFAAPSEPKISANVEPVADPVAMPTSTPSEGESMQAEP